MSDYYVYETSNKQEFMEAMDGWKYKLCLREMCDWLQGQYKHNIELTGDQGAQYERAREVLFEIMNENGVFLYE